MNYEQLDQADLSGLEQAATEWRSVKSAYEGLGDEYDQQVRRRLERSWEGDAAAAAQSEIAQVKKQMDAAAGEAGRMAKLLDDIHHDLHAFQKQLHSLEEEMRGQHLAVSGNGTISDNHPLHHDNAARHDPGMDDWRNGRQQLIRRYDGKIDAILKKATEADQTAETALKADRNGEDDLTFTKAGHTTLDQVAQAEKDAQRAAELMKNHPSPTELSELNKLLSKHANDPVFAGEFAKTAGVDGTLQSYMTMMNPPPGSGHDRKALLQKLQKNLGTTLGTATQIDSPAMDRFEKDLMAAGDNEYQSAGGRPGSHHYNGYQLTASLMANGEWDSKFLNDFGTELIQHEQDRYQFWGSDRESSWGGEGSALDLINSDPMVGFSDALGHNPEAATEFLSGSTETDDGKTDNLDYFLKDREWHGGDADIDHLGHALEAATTGVPYDYDGTTMPAHTPDQARLVNDLVTTLGNSENADLIDGDGRLAPIKDSLGEITASYMGDFQQAFATQDLPTNGAPVGGEGGIDRGNAINFMASVGQDPDAYTAITGAQMGYTQALVDETLADGNGQNFDRVQDRVINTTDPGSNVAGIMSEARAEAMHEHKTAEAQEFNSTVDEVNKWVGVGASTAAGLTASPVAGAAVGTGYEVLSGLVVDHIRQDNTAEADFEARTTYASGAQSHQETLDGMVRESAQAHGYSARDAELMGDTVAREGHQTFSAGAVGAGSRG